MTTTDGRRIASPLNDCDENIYTGVLTDPPGSIPGGSLCGFAYADISWQLPRKENNNIFMNFNYPIGDNTKIYVEGRAAGQNERLIYAPEPQDLYFVPTDDLKQNLIDSIDGLESGNFPENITVAHRFLGHGNRQWDEDIEEYDFPLGVEGQMTDTIEYHGFVHYYRYDYRQVGRTYIHQPTI